MNFQKFIERLTSFYENWGQESLCPKSNIYGQVLERVSGMTTANVMQLLNFAVACMETNEIYCEVGCFQGATLIGALLNHSNVMAYAVDDFSEFNISDENTERLLENLTVFNLEEQVCFSDLSFEEFFSELRAIQQDEKIGVYFYDGAHDYRSQLLSLLLIKPFLAEKALIIVDDGNLIAVKQANWDFIAAHPQCHLLLDLKTPHNSHRTFWNGLQVLSWDINCGFNYSWSTLERSRQEPIIKAISELSVDKELVAALYTEAIGLQREGKYLEAEEKYKELLQLDITHVDAYNNWGIILQKFCHFSQAELVYRQAIAIQPEHYGAHLNLGNVLYEMSRLDEAVEAYRAALKLKPHDVEIICNLLSILESYGRTKEAIDVSNEALLLLPNSLPINLRSKLILPILYSDQKEINFYRQRFIQGLEYLIEHIKLDTFENVNNAVTGLDYSTNFYLTYQGYDDLELQKQYGQLVHRIMAAKYPQWTQPLQMPPVCKRGKIRVGYISYCAQRTVCKLFSGWLRNRNPQSLEVYFYFPYRNMDLIAEPFKAYSDVFRQLPHELEAICEQIVSDQLHALIFLDVSMHAQATQLAALRLAPVQMTTWSHPITSGLPTVDYFLSNELMEPENAQRHYSEKLVCLPKIGISYSKPTTLGLKKARTDFLLHEQAVVYLSCQSLFKYLPQYDYIFANIARHVPKAQFVFLSHKSPDINRKFKQRLQRAFDEFGMNHEDYCVLLNHQDQDSYLNLNLVSDVFLDTLSWSGGNTTLEAIACHLPIVTCPGEFMRGRHSYGILKMLGVTETIANNEAEYIDIAVKLGLDVKWRDSVTQKMRTHHYQLYDDRTCVEALENFYQHVVQKAWDQQNS